jgi:hypothetical protein
VEISTYHGGAQRGHLRVPEGRRRAGWLRFADELYFYFLAKSEPEVAAPVGSGKVPETDMGLRPIRNGRNLNSKEESRKSRVRFDSAKFARRITHRELRSEVKGHELSGRVLMAETEPRPTRKWVFKWDPYPNTVRISKLEGQARQVTWIGLRQEDGPKDQQAGLDEPMLPVFGSLT